MVYFRFLVLILNIGAAAIISGCQSLGWLNQSISTSPSANSQRPALSSISTHEFTVSPDQELIGAIASVPSAENDTLPDIARHFGLGYNDITNANPGISAWTPKPGSRVILPLQFILPDAPRKGIVLNLANMRMFYYPRKEPGKVYTYPVGIGRDGWNTPMGVTSVAVKTPHPDWHVPPSIHKEHAERGHVLPRVVHSGPDNPLGDYAMRLAIGSYLIHGTNKPYGIGMQISHGCVQMYPENIEILFGKTPVGTPVKIIHQPYLTAWQDQQIYLEANEPIGDLSQSAEKLKKQTLKELRRMAKKYQVSVDWDKVNKTLQRADGIPTPVTTGSPDIQDISSQAVALVRPSVLHGQPVVKSLTDADWSMLVATFKNENEAQQLAAMLNHQGPPIPARKLQGSDNAYHVVAGPFKDRAEAIAAAGRIRFDFEIKPKLIEPSKTKDLAKL